MSTTQTQTRSEKTQTQPEATQPPTITIIGRVASIPMISSGLGTINDALTTNAYTRSPYIHAKALSNTAYKFTEPIQVVLAPLIIRADGIANMAVDAVESRYPYPFKAQPEEVVALARQGQQNTTAYIHGRVNVMNKAIDEKVRTPALNVVHDIDQVSLFVPPHSKELVTSLQQRFSPVIDYFEVAVTRVNGSKPSTPSDIKYQYQRALALSRTLGDNLYVYSNEQLKHIRAQSVIV